MAGAVRRSSPIVLAWAALFACACVTPVLHACSSTQKPASDRAVAGQTAAAGHSGGTMSTASAGRSGSPSNAGSGAVDTCSTAAPPVVAGCPVFTGDDAWNADVSCAPVDASWTSKLQAIVGSSRKLHPDYGNSGSEHYGIPINVVSASAPALPVSFDDYPDESDPGPYPFPAAGSARIEGGTPMVCSGDCHLLVVQMGACALYEGYACAYSSGGWHCSNGARWDLKTQSYGQRPKGWTSADAAGLPIMPGLVRVDEVRSGKMTHAIRFTLHCSRKNFVAPATHQAGTGSCDAASAPPMGLRVRLNPDRFDIGTLSPAAQVVAKAMQTYGMILADNGSDFYFQGEDDPRWTDTDVEPLKTIPAAAFDVIAPPPLEP